MIQEMKKQILAYRQEIIDLSTSKRIGRARRALRGGMDTDGAKVPRLDLSKVRRDSEDEEEEDEEAKGQTYHQYLKFLENESRFEELESQESLLRQEELKQRKNRIIQLLNGEVSDEEAEGHLVDQSSGNDFADDDLGEQSLDAPPTAGRPADEADVKAKHQSSKQDRAKIDQQQVDRQIRDFNEQLDEAASDVDLLRPTKKQKSF